MNKKYLSELLKYSVPNELYVITWDNQLIRINCPFKVRVIQQVAGLELGQELIVDEIKFTRDLKTTFIIEEQAFYYYYFDIIA